MSLYINTFKKKFALLLMFFVAQSAITMADNKLYIEDFIITPGETKEVAVILDNTDEVTQLNFDVQLPAGLTYVAASATKTDRISGRGATIDSNIIDGKVRIGKFGGNAIAAGSGAIITFTVRAGGTMAAGEFPITISDIVLADAGANNVATTTTSDATVTCQSYLGSCTFEANPTSIDFVAANEEKLIEISLNNDQVNNLAALSGKLTLPGGLSIVDGTDGKFNYTDRTPEPLEFQFTTGEGYVNFVLSSSTNTKITGNSGVVFSFTVKADISTLAANSEIVLSELTVATDGAASANVPNVTISVKNSYAEQQAADEAAFAEYQTEQEAAVEALAQDGDSNESEQIITDAKAAIEALTYDKEKTLEENKAAVDAIVAKAGEDVAAQREAEAAVQLAADKAAFAEYQAAQVAAVEAQAQDGDSEASQKIIADAKAAIEALTYDEEKTLAENKAAVDALVEPVADALTAQRAADEAAAQEAAAQAAKKAANDAAYIKLSAEIAALQDALDAAKTEVATKDKDVAAQFTADMNAIQKQINDAQAALDVKNAATELTAESIVAEKETINAAIEKLKSDAAAAQAAYEQNQQQQQEAAKKAANEAAYNRLSDQIASLQTKLDDAKNTIASDYASVAKNYDADVKSIQADIDKLSTNLRNRYLITSLDANSTINTADVEKAISELLAAAKEAQNKVDAGYKNETEQINALQNKLDQAQMSILTSCPDVAENYAEKIADIKKEIEALKTQADADYAAGTLTADSSIDADTVKQIEDEILAMAAEAGKAQAAFKANKDAYDALNKTLNEAQAELDAAKETLKAECPDVATQYDEQVAAIQKQIDDLKADLTKKYEAGELTAESTIDTAAVSKAVADMLAAAKKAQELVTAISRTRVVSGATGYYDMNGRRIETPAKGRTVIVKMADGSVKKMIIK